MMRDESPYLSRVALHASGERDVAPMFGELLDDRAGEPVVATVRSGAGPLRKRTREVPMLDGDALLERFFPRRLGPRDHGGELALGRVTTIDDGVTNGDGARAAVDRHDRQHQQNEVLASTERCERCHFR